MDQVDENVLRALDAEVHTKVMGATWPENRCRACGWVIAGIDPRNGCTLESCSQRPYPARRADEPPRYSTNLDAANLVVEQMRERGYAWNAQTPHGKGWEIQCYPNHSAPKGKKFRGLLPEAICCAALHALECLSISDGTQHGPASEQK